MAQNRSGKLYPLAGEARIAPGASTVPSEAILRAPDRPYSALLDDLLRLRWAEAEVACREAEDVIAWYASQEAQLAAAEARGDLVGSAN